MFYDSSTKKTSCLYPYVNTLPTKRMKYYWDTDAMVGRSFTDFLTSPSRRVNAGVMHAIIVFMTIKIKGHADLEEESEFSQRRVSAVWTSCTSKKDL